MRNLKLEKELYPAMFFPELKSVKTSEYDPLMENISKDETRYQLIWNIVKNQNQKPNLSTLRYLSTKNTFNLKEINHKWMKLNQNPDINPEDIFKDFTARF